MSKMEERFKKLVEAWSDDEDALVYIEKDMNAFANYVQAVYTMETKLVLAQSLYNHDIEKLSQIRYNLDSQRRNCHELAISAIKQLCIFANVKNVEPLYNGNLEDRYEIADFCRKVVLHFFDAGLTGTSVSHSFPHKNLEALVHSADTSEF